MGFLQAGHLLLEVGFEGCFVFGGEEAVAHCVEEDVVYRF